MTEKQVLTVHLDDHDQLVCQTATGLYRLRPQQVRILYALAESDHGRLSTKALCEVLFHLHKRSRSSQQAMPTSDQLHQLSALLAPLVEQQLVTVTAPTPGALFQGHVDQAGESLALVTWLTRFWPQWLSYSQKHGLFHY